MNKTMQLHVISFLWATRAARCLHYVMPRPSRIALSQRCFLISPWCLSRPSKKAHKVLFSGLKQAKRALFAIGIAIKQSMKVIASIENADKMLFSGLK